MADDENYLAPDPWAGGGDPFAERVKHSGTPKAARPSTNSQDPMRSSATPAAPKDYGSAWAEEPDSAEGPAEGPAAGEQTSAAGAAQSSGSPSDPLLPEPPTSAAHRPAQSAQRTPPGTRAPAAAAVVAVLVVVGIGVLGVVGGIVSTVRSNTDVGVGGFVEPIAVTPDIAFGGAAAQAGTVIPAPTGPLVVGDDVEPGIYVASEALATVAAGECWWSTSGSIRGVEGEHFNYGTLTEVEPLVVLGDGLSFEAYGCGDWVAVDPDEAFTGATAETFDGTWTVFGGKDVVPGTYLAHNPELAAEGDCFASAVDVYGKFGGDYGTFSTITQGGTSVLRIEAGQQVDSFNCGEFTKVDLDSLLAQDVGENSMQGDGFYLVGIDIRSGTYKATDAGPNCFWTRFPDAFGYDSENSGDSDTGYDVLTGDSITVETGQLIELYDCPSYERSGA